MYQVTLLLFVLTAQAPSSFDHYIAIPESETVVTLKLPSDWWECDHFAGTVHVPTIPTKDYPHSDAFTRTSKKGEKFYSRGALVISVRKLDSNPGILEGDSLAEAVARDRKNVTREMPTDAEKSEHQRADCVRWTFHRTIWGSDEQPAIVEFAAFYPAGEKIVVEISCAQRSGHSVDFESILETVRVVQSRKNSPLRLLMWDLREHHFATVPGEFGPLEPKVSESRLLVRRAWRCSRQRKTSTPAYIVLAVQRLPGAESIYGSGDVITEVLQAQLNAEVARTTTTADGTKVQTKGTSIQILAVEYETASTRATWTYYGPKSGTRAFSRMIATIGTWKQHD